MGKKKKYDEGWNFKTFKILMDERAKADRRALRLQTKELKRRLDVLNHAHEQALEERRLTVSAEKFEDFQKRYEADREATAKALTLAEGSDQGQRRGVGWIVGAFGFILTLISIYLVVGDVLTK